jgi:hypothetical protein
MKYLVEGLMGEDEDRMRFDVVYQQYALCHGILILETKNGVADHLFIQIHWGGEMGNQVHPNKILNT